jgi:hypothetical protein
MGVAGLAGAGLAGENGGEGAGFVADCVGGGAGREALERGLDGSEVVEGVKAVGAAAKFAGGLGAAEHEETEDRGLVATEVENGADAVLVLGDAGGWFSEAVADRGDEGEIFQRMEGLSDLFFGEIEHGVAAGALIARVDQRVQRERIVFGRGDLFFNEGAEDAELVGREVHVYKGATEERVA